MDENVYLFDLNVSLIFYSIELSRRVYIRILAEYMPIDYLIPHTETNLEWYF